MFSFTISASLACVVFCVLGLTKSQGIKNASDYAVAGRHASAFSVTGIIMGSLVAGGSTIGTAQLAYAGGVSAWWFTLGSGFGCALLGVCFAGPIRRLNLATLPELIEKNYGYPTALLTMSGSILGTLFSVVTQFQAGAALIRSVFNISYALAVALLSVLIFCFIFMGGLKSFSALGNAKTAMLFLMLVLCCLQLAFRGQTVPVLLRELPFSPWFNLFAFGRLRAIGSCASLMMGILCTQIYMQAVFAACDERAARIGCLTAAALIPPLGILAIWVGMAVKNSGIVVEASQVLPYYLTHYFHPLLGGVLWASLAISIIGGAAGLCLGVSTNLSFDVFRRVLNWQRTDRRLLPISRYAVILTIITSAALGLILKSTYILELSYIGMGLRSAGMVTLLTAAVSKPGFITPIQAFASALAGLTATLLSWLFFPEFEPVLVGLLASFVPLVLGRGFQSLW